MWFVIKQKASHALWFDGTKLPAVCLISRLGHYFLWFSLHTHTHYDDDTSSGNLTIVSRWMSRKPTRRVISFPSFCHSTRKILWIFIFISSFLRYPVENPQVRRREKKNRKMMCLLNAFGKPRRMRNKTTTTTTRCTIDLYSPPFLLDTYLQKLTVSKKTGTSSRFVIY